MKSLNRDTLPVRVRLHAWLNIGVQATFPFAGAFTPSVAGAGSNGRFLQDAAQAQLRTRAYTLSPGETVASVALSYNMTPAALKRLNQLRTPARGFDNLQPGNELDVPLAPLPPETWQDARTSAATDGDAQVQAVAR